MLNWGKKAPPKEDVVMKPASKEDEPMELEEKKKESKKKKKKTKKAEQQKPDISSGEEEQKAKSSKRSKKPKEPRQAVKLGDTPPGLLLVKDPGFPEIRDLGLLIRDNPHMCGDISKPDRCVGGKDEKKDVEMKVEEEVKTSVKENPRTKPLEHVECQKRLDALPIVNPIIIDGQTWKQSDKTRALRQNKLDLPLLTASLESELLQASGQWKHYNGRLYNFPACARGDRCVGMEGTVKFITADADNGKPFKHVLTAIMLPREYREFLKDGRAPQSKWPCVACMRTMLVDAVCAFRGGEALVGGSVTRIVMSEDMLLQSHRNPVECEDGYHREFCLEPSDEAWEGIIYPVPFYRASYLVARKGKFGRPYIDQSALVWKAGVTGKPGVGESIADFSTGVSSSGVPTS